MESDATKLRMNQAVSAALADAMREDESVVLLGVDVAAAGGVFKTSLGLLDEFGPDRVLDTPISEMAINGVAVGAAMLGLRPVAEIMFAEFFGISIDQVVTQAAKLRYLSDGALSIPMVVRGSCGAGRGFGATHSQTLEGWFLNQSGLKLAVASGPASAYGLLRSAIRDPDPVVLLEPKVRYGDREAVSRGEEGIIPLGRATKLRKGDDVTLVALGATVKTAAEAADRLVGEVACEVLDLQTLRPWDREAVLASVERTRRLVVVEESPWTGGWGGEIASYVASRFHNELLAPVHRITTPDAPVPFSRALEEAWMISVDDVTRQVRELVVDGGLPEPWWVELV